jgi:glycosyltransferase involved in cell wall biosynthesis
MIKRFSNIGILTFPLKDAGVIPLKNMVDIMKELSNIVTLITGNSGYDYFINNEYKSLKLYGISHKIIIMNESFNRIINYFFTQLKISYKFIIANRNVDLWIFFIGADILVVPMLIAKIFRKKVLLVLAGSSLDVAIKSDKYFSNIISLLLRFNYGKTDYIIVYSRRLIDEWSLDYYKHKIFVCHHHYLDFRNFTILNIYESRDNIIGYIGRISREKGIENFVKAIPNILAKKNNVRFLICGDGELRDEIEAYLRKYNLENKVTLTGWIPHEQLPLILNKLLLLVLPSYTEGLPNIILEAMACGTPVLATPVGAIKDIIINNQTGFIAEENAPELLAQEILRSLRNKNIKRIIEEAKEKVENEFIFSNVINEWKNILDNVYYKNVI